MLALMCGGQGTRSPSMFRLVESDPRAAPVLAEAAALLGRDPLDLSKDTGPMTNHASQIMAVAVTLALHACLEEMLPERLAVAGYSVGEMAAWGIAGVWPATLTLSLTGERARAMDEADGGRGRLAYVRGLGRTAVVDLAARHGCSIAITNPGDLFVVGGESEPIDAFCRAAEALGATRAAPLDVHVASHTPLLATAVAPFREALDSAPSRAPRPRRALLSGENGARIFRPDRHVASLAGALAHPLDWEATLNALAEVGADVFLDLGPGRALADMVRTVDGGARVRAADEFMHLAGLEEWLARSLAAGT